MIITFVPIITVLVFFFATCYPLVINYQKFGKSKLNRRMSTGPNKSPTLSQATNESYDEVSVLDDAATDSSGDDAADDDDEEVEDDGHSDHDDADNNRNETISLDDLLLEKNARIEALERASRMKDERLQLLQQKLNETKTRHKEGIYWLQLELDNARRENNATEEQMGELLSDLQGMTKLPNPAEVSEEVLRDATIKNYEQALASMENQITMIKTSAGEVVKTLKEEIAELMEDRASMEVDLLNQLAALDNEKSIREAEFEHELKAKHDTIRRLLSAGGTATTSAETADLEEYEAEISRLMEDKKKIEEKLTEDCEQAYEEVQRLELANARLKADLDRAEDDLELFQSEGDPDKTKEALQTIAREREDTVEALQSVAAIWEKANAAIVALEDSMDQLRPDDDVPVKGDRERLLSTLETASLVHGQVKVSLMLIELKLRNQLQSLKNDKLQTGLTNHCDDKVVEQMKSIQTDVLKVIAQVEATLSGQIQEIEQRTLEETRSMKEAIQKRSVTLDTMQIEHKALEEEISRLKATNGSAVVNLKDEEAKSSSNNDNDAVLNGISRAIVDELQLEVLRILERVKEKNTLIEAMKRKIEENKASEERLKKELKRALRKQATSPKLQNGNKASETVSPRRSPKAAVIATISPTSPVPRSPVKSIRRSSLDAPLTSPKIVNSGISPLAPSPRELKSRVSLLVSPIQPPKMKIPKSTASD